MASRCRRCFPHGVQTLGPKSATGCQRVAHICRFLGWKMPFSLGVILARGVNCGAGRLHVLGKNCMLSSKACAKCTNCMLWGTIRCNRSRRCVLFLSFFWLWGDHFVVHLFSTAVWACFAYGGFYVVAIRIYAKCA